MSVHSFEAIVFVHPLKALCIAFQDGAKDKVTDERFIAFVRDCSGEPVHRVQDGDGFRIEGYACADPSDPDTVILSMWTLADLSFKHFGIETSVAAPRR